MTDDKEADMTEYGGWTYNPDLSHCYGCGETLNEGDECASWYENYVHAWCLPTAYREATRTFIYHVPEALKNGG